MTTEENVVTLDRLLQNLPQPYTQQIIILRTTVDDYLEALKTAAAEAKKQHVSNPISTPLFERVQNYEDSVTSLKASLRRLQKTRMKHSDAQIFAISDSARLFLDFARLYKYLLPEEKALFPDKSVFERLVDNEKLYEEMLQYSNMLLPDG